MRFQTHSCGMCSRSSLETQFLMTDRLAVVAGAPVHDDIVARIGDDLGVTVLNVHSLVDTASTLAVARG